jgi:hypothetical protein
MRTIVLGMVVLIALAGVARAGGHYTLTLNPSGGVLPKDGCTLDGPTAITSVDDELEVSTSGTLSLALEIHIGSGGATLAHKLPNSGATGDSPIKTAIQGQPIAVWDIKANKQLCVRNAPQMAVGPASPGTTGTGISAISATTDPAAADAVALAAMMDQTNQGRLNITSHAVTGREAFDRTFGLYHLPSGAMAFPTPPHISEKDTVEIWIVLPEQSSAQVEFVNCDKVPGIRVAGSYKAAIGALNGKTSVAPTYQAHMLWRGRCAGTMTYKITTTDKFSATTSIPIDPVYRFEWGVGYMFDFGRPHQLSLQDRMASGGMGTEKFVSESSDFTGSKPAITLSVDVCGTNPQHLTWCDRFLNPTLWIDPTRAASGFGFGLGIRPFYGLTILAGATVFQTTKLADGLDIKAGSTWTASGGLATKQVFGTDSIGLAIAATVTSDVFALLSGK